MFHLCFACGRNLGASSIQPRQASARELLISRLVCDFLDSDYFNNPEAATRFSQFLSDLIERDFQGNAALMAKSVGVAKSVVHGWQMSGFVPSLQRCAELAIKFSCSIESLFVNTLPAGRVPALASVPAPLAKPRNKLHVVDAEQRLKFALLQPEPVSVFEVARELKVQPRSLYFAFDSLAKEVARKRRHFMSQRQQAAVVKLEEVLRFEAKKLLEEGVNPTQRRLTERLGLVARPFERELKAMCRRVLQEERQRAHLLLAKANRESSVSNDICPRADIDSTEATRHENS